MIFRFSFGFGNQLKITSEKLLSSIFFFLYFSSFFCLCFFIKNNEKIKTRVTNWLLIKNPQFLLYRHENDNLMSRQCCLNISWISLNVDYLLIASYYPSSDFFISIYLIFLLSLFSPFSLL